MSPRTVDHAASQLRRLLIAIPALADDRPHRIADVAELVGVSVDTLARDLRTLVTRFEDGPGGFMEGVRLAFTSDTVQLESTLFRRPMGLTPGELGALELGLAALARELPPHEAAVASRARERMAEASTGLGANQPRPSARAASLVSSDRDCRQPQPASHGDLVASKGRHRLSVGRVAGRKPPERAPVRPRVRAWALVSHRALRQGEQHSHLPAGPDDHGGSAGRSRRDPRQSGCRRHVARRRGAGESGGGGAPCVI